MAQQGASVSRRALIGSTASLLASTHVWAAFALDDLDAPGDIAAPSAPGDGFVKMNTVTLSDGPKTKKSGPFERMKELQAKGNLTDKEKKELRRLKSEEMCEMLGKGC